MTRSSKDMTNAGTSAAAARGGAEPCSSARFDAGEGEWGPSRSRRPCGARLSGGVAGRHSRPVLRSGGAEQRAADERADWHFHWARLWARGRGSSRMGPFPRGPSLAGGQSGRLRWSREGPPQSMAERRRTDAVRGHQRRFVAWFFERERLWKWETRTRNVRSRFFASRT